MSTETWDANKLRIFINHYGLIYKDVATVLNVEPAYIGKLINQSRSLDGYHELLTGYKNAIKAAKIAETKAYCEMMIEHYNNFE